MLFNGRALIFTFSGTQVKIAEIERLQSLFKMSMCIHRTRLVRQRYGGMTKIHTLQHFLLTAHFGMLLPSWLCMPTGLIYNACQYESVGILMMEKA